MTTQSLLGIVVGIFLVTGSLGLNDVLSIWTSPAGQEGGRGQVDCEWKLTADKIMLSLQLGLHNGSRFYHWLIHPYSLELPQKAQAYHSRLSLGHINCAYRITQCRVSMFIEQLACQDAQVYQCTFTYTSRVPGSSHVKVNRFHDLTIKVPPRWPVLLAFNMLHQPINSESAILAFTKLLVKCTAEVGSPQGKGHIRWTVLRNGQPEILPVDNDGRPREGKVDRLVGQSACSEVYQSQTSVFVTNQDQSIEVACFAVNQLFPRQPLGACWEREKNWCSTTGNIMVYDSTKTITVSRVPEGAVYEGGTLSLSCHANGFPRPGIFWNRAGNPGQMLMYEWHTAGMSTLVLNNLKLDDSDTYSCTARNTVFGESFEVKEKFDVVVKRCETGVTLNVSISVQSGPVGGVAYVTCSWYNLCHHLSWEYEIGGRSQVSYRKPGFTVIPQVVGLQDRRMSISSPDYAAINPTQVTLRIEGLRCHDYNKKLVCRARYDDYRTANKAYVESSALLKIWVVPRPPYLSQTEPSMAELQRGLRENSHISLTITTDTVRLGKAPYHIVWKLFRLDQQPEIIKYRDSRMSELKKVPLIEGDQSCSWRVENTLNLTVTRADQRLSIVAMMVDPAIPELSQLACYNPALQLCLQTPALYVHYGVSDDNMKITLNPRRLFRNQKLVMTCKAEGYPKPKYTWKSLSTSEPPLIGADDADGGNYIVIDHANAADEGAYTCEATNQVFGQESYAMAKVWIFVLSDKKLYSTRKGRTPTNTARWLLLMGSLALLVTIVFFLVFTRHTYQQRR